MYTAGSLTLFLNRQDTFTTKDKGIHLGGEAYQINPIAPRHIWREREQSSGQHRQENTTSSTGNEDVANNSLPVGSLPEHQTLPTAEDVMEELREVTIQYTHCAIDQTHNNVQLPTETLGGGSAPEELLSTIPTPKHKRGWPPGQEE